MTARGFRSIIGEYEAKRHFQAAIASGRVAHAYLITGDAGSGKTMLAEAFAETLVCETRQAKAEEETADTAAVDACLNCLSCRKAIDGNHPDIISVTHEKPGVISVGEVREQVVSTVSILPYESRYKIYLIEEAEKMNPQAQNALLKTIEEPPEYAVIILMTASPEALLDTIRSRCVTIATKPVPDDELEAYLSRELTLPDYETKMLAAFAQGNVGRALRAATDEGFLGRRDKTLGLIRTLKGMDTAAMSEAVRRMKEDKVWIDDVLDILLMWYRDVMYFKATADIDHLIFAREISTIRAQASTASYEGLKEILDAIDRFRVRLRANVNFELAAELMLLTIKENCNA